MRVLIDMDGVLADFEGGFLREWRRRYPQREYIEVVDRKDFKITTDYAELFSDAYTPDIRGIYAAPGFFRDLAPISGGLRAVEEMQQMSMQVFICTSPITTYQNCVLEKYEWVERHLGPRWIDKIILTKDKTVIRADVLIDDKPVIVGAEKDPCWEHILFDAPYNRQQNGKRRLTWENWKAVLLGSAENAG